MEDRERAFLLVGVWQRGKHPSFPVGTVIPNQVSFAEMPSTHHTSKQPFHESLVLFLGKGGLTECYLLSVGRIWI